MKTYMARSAPRLAASRGVDVSTRPETARGRIEQTAERVSIRLGDDRDWSQIWPFWRRIVAAGRTHPYPQDIDERAAARLWLLPAPARIHVAEIDRRARAAILVKPYRFGPGDHVAGLDLMVDPDCWGLGIGRRLAEHAIAQATDDGYRAIEFYSVVDTNTRALALWRSLGFTTLAVVPEAFRHPDHGLVGVHLMRRQLA